MNNTVFIISDNFDPIIRLTAIKLLEHILRTNSEITYGELVNKLKPDYDISPRHIEKFLGYISYACKDNGLPCREHRARH